ncbi:MAG: hypothetical protein ACI4FZ_01625 [Lachnospiraceae bacterium]
MAYEWLFVNDTVAQPSPAGPGGPLSEFQKALSKQLAERYITYVNSMGLRHPETGEELTLGADGRSGGIYDILMQCLKKSAATYLKKLSAHEVPVQATSEQYLSGDYRYLTMPPVDPAIFAPLAKDPHAVIKFPPLVEKKGEKKSGGFVSAGIGEAAAQEKTNYRLQSFADLLYVLS